MAMPVPRRRRSLGTWILAGFLVALLGIAGWFYVYIDHPLGGNCNDWYVYCPTGPGATPLGTSLQIGNGTGACAAGNGSLPGECAYTFVVAVYELNGTSVASPGARVLNFAVLGPSGAPVTSAFSVSLVANQEECATWHSGNSTWTYEFGGGLSGCLNSPIASGDEFLLRALPQGGLPFSHMGDTFEAIATGDVYTGTVDAPIE